MECKYILKSNSYKKQNNCLRVETINYDHCSLKIPEQWSNELKERAYILIMNGNFGYFGICDGNCPKIPFYSGG